jgi:hypothetical protein
MLIVTSARTGAPSARASTSATPVVGMSGAAPGTKLVSRGSPSSQAYEPEDAESCGARGERRAPPAQCFVLPHEPQHRRKGDRCNPPARTLEGALLRERGRRDLLLGAFPR